MLFRIIFVITLFISWSSFAGKGRLPFEVFLTKEKLSFKESFGTFKVKRKVKEICYPYQVIEKESVIIATFPKCDQKIQFVKKNDAWEFSSLSKSSLTENFQPFINFHFPKKDKELFYGLGTQYTHFILNGHKFPILAQEQGNGRGQQPLSFWQRIVASGIQGHEYTTYMAQAFMLSSLGKSIYLESPSYMEVDLTFSKVVRISHHTLNGKLFLNQSASPKDSLLNARAWLGNQPPLPDWIHKGAILGLMGGTKEVMKRVTNLLTKGASLSGVWLQDWVGTRKTFLGPRLQWNWRLSRLTYPNWDLLQQYFRENNLKTLGYFNPYLSEFKNTNNYLDYAIGQSYLVEKDGRPLTIEMGGFKAYLVDLFNPEAFEWLKEILIEQARENHLMGWMADFGEAYPMSGQNSSYHHLYILKWQQLNREVRLNLDQERKEKTVAFHRAGSIQSLKNVGLFWLGDQTPTYDEFDGLKSTIRGLLSSGLNGIAYNHSDIGGYFAIQIPLILSVKRNKALLKRWMEVNAFTMVFRTHLGLKPKLLFQVDQDEEILKEFVKWSHIFSGLHEYRKSLIKEYQQTALPPVRPLFLEFPNEKSTYKIDDQFMLGPKYLVAPLYQDYQSTKKLYLPKGDWKHLWDGKSVTSRGEWINFKVFQNTTPVFVKITRERHRFSRTE